MSSTFGAEAVEYVQSVHNVTADELRPWRVGSLLFGGFGILALIVAALGTYSVLSFQSLDVCTKLACGWVRAH